MRFMNSSMIGKIEKAHRYAREPERVRLSCVEAIFQGSHDAYQIRLKDGHWTCSCHTFSSHAVGTCSHVMALQHMLAEMLPNSLRYDIDAEAPMAASSTTG
jgi:hypothetical protein